MPTLPVIDKRKIAESLVEKIVIGEGEIDITFSYLPSCEEACKNQQRLVALLGCAQRQIRASRSHLPVNRKPVKTFPTALKTLGDHIHAKRFEKGLQLGKLAEKLAIPASSVRRWETDLEKPSEAQWQTLVVVLGLRQDLMSVLSNT